MSTASHPSRMDRGASSRGRGGSRTNRRNCGRKGGQPTARRADSVRREDTLIVGPSSGPGEVACSGPTTRLLDIQNAPSSSAKTRKPCFAWDRKGKCFKGDACPYFHKSKETQTRSTSKERPQDGHNVKVPSLPSTSALRSNSNGSCHEWNKTGACKRKNGRFEHDMKVKEEIERADETARQIQELVRARRVAEQHQRDAEIDARRAEIAREEAEKLLQHIVHDHAIVTYSAGMAVHSLVPGFNTCRVQIKGLPLDATGDEILQLFTQQGIESAHIVMNSTKPCHEEREPTQIADLLCHEDARIAALGLDGIEFRESTLSFEILENEGSGMKVAQVEHQDPKVLTVSWRLPSMAVVVTFLHHVDPREKARQLDGEMCSGRKVSVVVNTGPRGTTISPRSNQIVVRGLDPSMTDVALKNFAGHDTALRRLKVHNLYNAQVVDAQLNGVENLSRQEDDTRNPASGWRQVRLHFPNPADAQRGLENLQSQRVGWGTETFKLSLPDPLQFSITIPRLQYNSQRTQWASLVRSSKQKEGCKLILRELQNICELRVSGQDKKAVGALKVQVERLAGGEKLDAWHPWFSMYSSRDFLKGIARDTGAFIRSEPRLRILKVYGESQNIERALLRIREEVERREGLKRVVHLKTQSIGYFIRQGLATLREELGDDNVALRISSRPATITIQGGEAARHALDRVIKDSLDTLAAAQPSTALPDDACPICYVEITSPVRLGCGHSYCTPCLRHYLASASDSTKFPLVCIGDDDTCSTPIPIPTVQKFLPVQQFRQLADAAFGHYVASHPQDYRYCTTPDCNQIYSCSAGFTKGNIVHCPSCLAETCSACHAEGHEGMTCEERRISVDPIAQERANEELALRSGFKKCPSCSVWIEKTEGCNHMACRCGVHICWVCMGTFEHHTIYQHMNAAHGGIDGDQPVVAAPLDPYGENVDYAEQEELLRQAERRRAQPAGQERWVRNPLLNAGGWAAPVAHAAYHDPGAEEIARRHREQLQRYRREHEEWRVQAEAQEQRRRAGVEDARRRADLQMQQWRRQEAERRAREENRGGGWGCIIS